MTRWHRSSCVNPDVVFDEKRDAPRCQACDAQCDLKRLVSAQPKSPALVIPPNEPSGQLNLRWPPSIFPPSTGSTFESPPNPPTNRKSDGTGATSVVYDERLGPNEFRLACFSAADNAGAPVHFSLETYHRDNCPEYETVSHTWGGEDDDYTLCRPAFVGPHWDVLFQSRNCWEMLRFIRPRREILLVWVDAVCINQNDVKERGEQVTT